MIQFFNKKMSKKRKGFTLIELVVVIAILGILAALAIPRFTAVRTTAERQTHNGNVRTLESAATVYLADEGLPTATETWNGTAGQNWEDYMQEWPAAVGNRTAYSVEITDDGTVTVTPIAEPAGS